MSAIIRGVEMERAEEGNKRRAVGVIETDLFCRGCGYNLHLQRVWKDERLGVMVCRCPECGAHEAAELASGMGNLWSRQFGQLMLALWVCVIVIGATWVVMGFCSEQRNYVCMAMDARRFAAAAGTSDWLRFYWLGWAVLNAFWIAAGISVMMMHRKRAWGYLAAFLPAVGVGITIVTAVMSDGVYLNDQFGWATAFDTAQMASYQIVGIMLGAWMGRAMVRRIAGAMLPAWAIKGVGFLWLAEGKELPVRVKR